MRLVLIITMLLSFASPAPATPPRGVSIHDHPVAHTKTHLFLVRTVSDNIGYHQTNLTHIFLIRQNMATGVVEVHWPLRHLLTIDDWVKTDGKLQHTVELHEPPKAGTQWERWRSRNPLKFANAADILRKANTEPLSPFNIDTAHTSKMSWAVSPHHGLVKGIPKQVFGDERGFITAIPMYLRSGDKAVELPGEASVLRSPEVLRKTLLANMLPTLNWLQDNEAPTESKVDPMSWDRSSLPMTLDFCAVRDHISLPITGRKEFVSIDCWDDAEVGRFRVWVATDNPTN